MGLCQDAGLLVFFPRVATALGAAYTLVGRVADAITLLTQAMERTIVTEMIGRQALCSLALGEALVQAGRLEEALALAERALALTRAHQERGNQAYALRLLGEIAARTPRWSSRPRIITSRPSPWPPNSGCAPSSPTAISASANSTSARARGLGKLYKRTGTREQAREHLTTATAMYREMDMPFWMEKAEAEIQALA